MIGKNYKKNGDKCTRQLSIRVVVLELALLVSFRFTIVLDWTNYTMLIICALLTAHTSWKDHKEGLFDGLTICYICISIAICGVMLAVLL